MLPRRRRLPRVPRAARPRRRATGRSSTRRAASSARTTGTGASRPASGAGSASAAASRSTRCATSAATNTVVVGPRESLARDTRRRAGRLYVPVERVEVKLRYRSPAVAADVEPTARGFRLELDEPVVRGRPRARPRCSTRTTSWSAAGSSRRLRGPLGSPAMLASFGWSDLAYLALAVFLFAVGRRASLRRDPPRRNPGACFLVHTGNGDGAPARDLQDRRNRGPRERAARQGRSR